MPHGCPFLPRRPTALRVCIDVSSAAALFQRGSIYYAFVSICSCFGKGGADVWVFTASTALGPYTRHGDLGNAERAQQNYVFQAPLASGELVYVWTGDRWKSTPDGQKAHDFQFWQPLNFTDHDRGTGPVVAPLQSPATLPSFQLDLLVA